MQLIFLDYETFWSDDYTLKKLTPIEYIQDPRFEALGCAFIVDGEDFWVDGPNLPAYLSSINWADTYVVSHNALFDAVILAERYNVFPACYGDTLSMARNWLSPSLPTVSLAAVAQYYGLPAKWTTVAKTKGITYAMLKANPELDHEVQLYARDDALKCETIFWQLLTDGFPETELEVIDMVIRMATQPKLELDAFVLSQHLNIVRSKKDQLLQACGVSDKAVLMSDIQLRERLEYWGVDPVPTKISPTTGAITTAFAKSDRQFTQLLEHPEPQVQALVAARLGHKSTLEETRTERLISIARCSKRMPIPLKYSGAHTHRFSGDWKINLQNLPRGGELRRALRAPRGHMIVSVDASQIEARITATLAREDGLVAQFARGEDVYASFASRLYGFPVTKASHPKERNVGKVAILSLGYGSGAPTFMNMCHRQGIEIDIEEATATVFTYRSTYHKLRRMWRYASQLLAFLARGNEQWWDPVQVTKQAIVLPNGNRIRYRDLRQVNVDGETYWQYMRGMMPQRLYGAKIVENVVQALAFIHIMETALRVKALTERLLLPAHQVHDELLYVVEERHAEIVRDLVVKEMSRSPEWMPKAPLAAEGHIGKTYYDCK